MVYSWLLLGRGWCEGTDRRLDFPQVFAFSEVGGIDITVHRHQLSARFIDPGDGRPWPPHEVALHLPQPPHLGRKSPTKCHLLNGAPTGTPWSCSCLQPHQKPGLSIQSRAAPKCGPTEVFWSGTAYEGRAPIAHRGFARLHTGQVPLDPSEPTGRLDELRILG